ncbi:MULTISPECIES: ectoine/hydroxyectoine ABC transporter substrate-binding protein EhuB [unclassified Mesorhizobium]|uniref:ectoine/hydroxyectoine ABC transporter substrate-binding protein EhuB n=1 Tax=unclassified Mesorhizobium TaxID=325217 RepID=UPI000FD88D23|nr:MULTISPECIES: ectoine/hydroxyectoine ABC transporter substrate-binding protein EhuB [unclassified Mesorhizobium]TGQ37296.1 ectoine/hydroxyectoine ABC transporter substrate-binding protein EhuB [Mesorhizobium sp. M00.F.Ca.ET.216.01.1.1]TIS56609.1 MAG: ectoine/hydroxyectoine ABC transporter substrate-binding protein EhuB [Mesorhizobium sp.]TIS89134.1 MAG: ectoine/hydroxyectoine ABC transporter substrate-binding protein EhuB [Mesorhizobium sp.]
MLKSSISRRMVVKAAACIALAATSLASLPAHAETTLERAKKDGYIRVGFANEAPFGYATPDGKLTGEAPEVAKAVLAKLGISQVDGVLTEFGSLIPGLKAGRFDIIAAGMFITPKRCAEINYSEPSYGIGEAMLVAKGNPKGVKDFSSIKDNPDLKLAVMAGAVEGGFAKDAGVADGQIVSLPDQSSLVAAVQSGRADAAALTALSIADMAKKADGVESTKPFGEVGGKSVKGHGGFGFRKEDTDLLEAFNAELKKFIGSPEHIALVEPLGFGKDYLPNKTTAELCAGK